MSETVDNTMSKEKKKEEEDTLSEEAKKVDSHEVEMATNSKKKEEKKNEGESGQAAVILNATSEKNGHSKAKKSEAGGGDTSKFGSGIEIIHVKERHGQFRKAVPTMPLPLAIVLCLVNCLLPGIGTLISGFTVFCGTKTEIETRSKAFWLNVVAAILQIITLPIIVGWIWSIIWGVTFITSSLRKENGKEENPESAQQV